MNKYSRSILTIILVFGVLVSAGMTVYLQILANRDAFGEWLAPVQINIEIDKNFAHDMSIFAEPHNDQYYYLNPTTSTADPGIKTIIMHTELPTRGFYQRIYIRIPQAQAAGTISAIDNISIFVGNKLFYFTKEDVSKFTTKTQDGYALFYIPGLHYTKSLIVKDWINYYGEFNIALKVFCSFLFNPFRFFVTYLFLFGLFWLYRRRVVLCFENVKKHPHFWPIAAVTLITIFAFLLRWNGYVRHSGWSDEIWCATRGGNPFLPFSATFSDPGNPPFYFILLRFFFQLFGWSEETGTMLSVLLGTFAVPFLYLFVKSGYGSKTALLASLFLAVSGFALNYSQEMRAYILQIFLAPLIALCFFHFLKKPCLKNLVLYVLLCIFMANTHFYGILFIMSNFIFYCFYTVCGKDKDIKNKKAALKKILFFLAGNLVIALSFMPYFLYYLIIKKYSFNREFTIQTDHICIMALIVLLGVFAFTKRKQIKFSRVFSPSQTIFFIYVVFMPIMIYALSFIISFKRPMIEFKYLLPISFPFLLSCAAVVISLCKKQKQLAYVCILLIWAACAALQTGKARIFGDGTEYFRESRAYITQDIKNHPFVKSAILSNNPAEAHYYGYPDVPEYSGNHDADVVYVFNGYARMHEYEMYDDLKANGLDDTNMLKIYPCDQIVIFKKYMRQNETRN